MRETNIKTKLNDITPSDTLFISCVLFLLAYIFLCIIFAELRLYKDASYYLFKIVSQETFGISHNRYSGMINRFPVVVATIMNLDLKTILYVYTLTPAIIYCLFFILFYKGLKRVDLALALIVATLFYNSHRFYFPICELQLAMPFALLFYYVINDSVFQNPSRTMKCVRYSLLCLIGAIVLFWHPATIFYIAFLVGFEAVSKKNISWRIVAMVAIALCISAVVVFMSVNPYEKGKYTTKLIAPLSTLLANNTYGDVVRIICGGAVDLLYVLCRYYPVCVLGFIAIPILYRRDKLSSIFVLLIVVGYLVFAEPMFHIVERMNGPALVHGYAERGVRPLLLFIGLPICIVLFKSTAKMKTITLTLVNILFFCTIYGMASQSKIYAERKERIVNIIKAPDFHEEDKIILWKSNLAGYISKKPEFFGAESLIYSSIMPDMETKLIILDDEIHNYWPTLRQLEIKKPGYFDLKSEHYVSFSNRLTTSDLKKLDFSKIHTVPFFQERLKARTKFILPVHIINENDFPLHSGFDGNFVFGFKYDWKRGNEFVGSSGLIPLYFDIHTHYLQHIPVKTPNTPGEFKFMFRLILKVEESTDEWPKSLITLTKSTRTFTVE